MARKIPKARTSPRVLFIELLVPWVIMALVGLLAVSAGFSEIGTLVIALLAALAATFLIRVFERNRLRKKQMTQL